MRIAVISLLALAGCASEQYVSGLGAYDVCRLTMGGPHAVAAETEARRRGIDCAPLYPAIQATEANRNAAAMQYLQLQQRPAPAFAPQTTCTTQRIGNQLETACR